MAPDVTSVRHLQGHQLEVGFADGTRAEVDLTLDIMGKGGVFKPLEDVRYFARVWVDAEIGTIVWPNNADFSPEFLYELATAKRAPAAAR